jgi:hypothetical protein
MLVIRDVQFEVFQKAASESFKQRVLAHFQECCPEEIERRGESAIRVFIDDAVFRARRYGVETEFDVMRFIDHQLVLGDHFDADSRLPWASRILTAPDLPGSTKMDILSARTERELASRKPSMGATPGKPRQVS